METLTKALAAELASRRRKTAAVELPGAGCKAHVRELTGAEVGTLGDTDASMASLLQLAALYLSEADGTPIADSAADPFIRSLTTGDIQAIVNAGNKLNGFDEEEIKATEGN